MATPTPLRYEAVNPALKRSMQQALSQFFPIASEDGKLEVRATNITLEGGFDAHGLNAHQTSRQQGKTLGVPIKADLEVWRDGKRESSAAQYQLGTLPMMNALGTFMVGGSDYYTPMAQLRLKPGAYTREKNNGEYETFIPMKGAQMSVWMDPAKGVFKLGLYSTNVSWYAIVRALGATDEEIIKGLGGDKRAREIVAANEIKNPDADVKKLFLAIFEKNVNRDLVRAGVQHRNADLQGVDKPGQVAALKQWMDGKKVDPYVTEKTMGQAFSSMNTPLLIQAAKRILGVSRGDEEPDDRDALEFKSAMGIEDMMPERLQKQGRLLKRKILQRMARPDSQLARAFGRDFLGPVTTGYFGGTEDVEGGLAHTAEAANPLAILSEHSKLTVTGEGGIGSDHAITLGARLFRPGSVNFVDPVHTPEGSKIGIATHTAINVRKRGTQLEAPFEKVVDGKVDRIGDMVFLTVEEAEQAVVGYPEYWNDDGSPKSDEVRANVHGRIEMVPASSVKYVVPSGASMFDHTSNAALFMSHTHSNRGMMAGKHLTQALPLIHRENPLMTMRVSKNDKADALESLARTFTIRSRVDGVVEKVEPNKITISGEVHEIYDNYPMQAKVGLHHTPVVSVGQRVVKDQLIADSNYSKDGKLALGVNLRSAYMPWKNASNFEDSIPLSESAAKKLTSEHLHRLEIEVEPGLIVDKNLTIAQFPTKVSKEAADRIGTSGVVSEGSKIKPGDMLISAVRKSTFDARDQSAKNLGTIHKMLERPYRDASIYWDEIFPGTVYRVIRTDKKIEVHVRTEEPVQVGDKLSMSSAAKGTISMIIPDDKMPRTKDGKHIEVILNTHGVPSRINPSQTIEQAVGKLVRDGGEKYEFANFDDVNHAQQVKDRLEAKGLSHAETLFDPETGKDLERPVAVGYNYMVKLDHAVRKKFSARGRDSYTLDETPTSGKGTGGQSYDPLTTYALLGHNAHAIIAESVGIRGTKNEDFWRAYQAGETPPPPKIPFIFKKLETYLNAAGVDTQQHGNIMNFLPLTEKRILERSNGKIESGKLLKTRAGQREMSEETGGLFDPKVTGGLFGDKWAHIELAEKIPHPLYEKVIRDITGLKTSEYYGLIAHTKKLNPVTGKIGDEGELTGEDAFRHLLTFNADDRIAKAKAGLRTAVGSDANKLNRAVRYLRGLKTTGLNAAEAYLTGVLPVVPPNFRGIQEMTGGSLRVADSNLLYRDVLLTNEQVAKGKDEGLPPDHLADARTSLYKSVGALVGINNPLTHRDDREDAKGFVDIIRGKQNKEGFFQRVVARRRNDYTGRSTIEPDANLGVDEIGIPEDMAWKIYEPTVVRRMSQAGWKPAEALQEVQKRTLAARNALNSELEHRPVIYNRSPSLHRWSIAAGRASITPGKEIKISPGVIGPFNADFDGDTMAVHVPITEAARQEAHRLLPSSNLFYDRDRSLTYKPEKDVITGIFALTRPGTAAGKSFDSADEAIDAYRNNKSTLLMSSMVNVKGVGQQSIGWLIFAKIVPPRFLAGVSAPVDGKKLETILGRIAKESPGEYNVLVRRITQAGFQAAAAAGGITATVNELAIDRTKIDALLKQMEREIGKGKTYADKQKISLEQMAKIQPELQSIVKEHLAKEDAGYHMFLEAKPSGKINASSFQQMLASPVLMSDSNDRVVPSVIKSAYGTGMAASDYVLTTPGARKGLVAKSLATALPGALAKEIAGNLGSIRIVEKDCGTTTGIDEELSPENPLKGHDTDILDRHLLRDTRQYKRNDVVTPEMLARLRDMKVTDIWVRSPLTCKSSSPPCQMCAGRSPDGELHAIGANIGLNYGQGISERSTQLTLKMFHSGGTLGSGESLMQGFERFRELLSAPETVKNQGALADVTGTISSIRAAPQGGWYISIRPIAGGDAVEQYVMTGRTLNVRAGAMVQIGDKLSDGSYRPQELASKKDMLTAQRYVVNQSRKAYMDAGEVIRKPVLEVLVAGMMRYVEITDDGGEDDIAVGDVIHENDYEKRKAKNPKVKAKPSIPGLAQKPLMSKDLFERLGFQRLEDAVRDVPASGGHSDLTGNASPIAGIAYGANFRPTKVAQESHERRMKGDVDEHDTGHWLVNMMLQPWEREKYVNKHGVTVPPIKHPSEESE